jgi:hypothetical protein
MYLVGILVYIPGEALEKLTSFDGTHVIFVRSRRPGAVESVCAWRMCVRAQVCSRRHLHVRHLGRCAFGSSMVGPIPLLVVSTCINEIHKNKLACAHVRMCECVHVCPRTHEHIYM